MHVVDTALGKDRNKPEKESKKKIEYYKPQKKSVEDSEDSIERLQLKKESSLRMDHVVLIVDDELFNRIAIRSLLAAENIPSSSVADGVLAIERFKLAIDKGDPVHKIVLMDYSMPGMNGP